jgi:hypothetical protein
MSSMLLVVAVVLAAFHASSVGHVRDSRGRYVHTIQVDRALHGRCVGFNAARSHAADGDECTILASHSTADIEDPLAVHDARTSIDEARWRPRARDFEPSALYRQAPKTSPPDAARPSSV